MKNCPTACAEVAIRLGDATNVALLESEDSVASLTATGLYVMNGADFIAVSTAGATTVTAMLQ